MSARKKTDTVTDVTVATVATEVTETVADAAYEPILDPKNRKFTVFPIKYPGVWQLYKEQLASMWKAEEIDFSGDYEDFQTLNDDEKHFVKRILAMLVSFDGIVNLNLSERFIRDVQITEAQVAYQFQIMMENIHNEVYSLMLDNVVKDPVEREFLFGSIHTIPSIKRMADWTFKWVDSKNSFAHRIVAFAIVEGVFFSGAFASIFWLKKYKNKGKTFMNGLIKSNKFIARDEGLHCKFACEIYSLLNNKISTAEVNKIMKEAVTISQQFMTEALQYQLIGMNKDLMNEYIEYIGDRLLVMLGYKKMFLKSNPFKFMETIGLCDKTNLHESRPAEYPDSHVFNKSKGKRKVVINDDF